jgi:uncharacterized protein YneF (UPF0154 family)
MDLLAIGFLLRKKYQKAGIRINPRITNMVLLIFAAILLQINNF